jgi:hypothetical protein
MSKSCPKPPSTQEQQNMSKQYLDLVEEFNAKVQSNEKGTEGLVFIADPLLNTCQQTGGALLSEKRIKQILTIIMLASSVFLLERGSTSLIDIFHCLNIDGLLPTTNPLFFFPYLAFGGEGICADVLKVLSTLTSPAFVVFASAKLLECTTLLMSGMKGKFIAILILFNIYNTFVTDKKKDDEPLRSSSFSSKEKMNAAKEQIMAALEAYSDVIGLPNPDSPAFTKYEPALLNVQEALNAFMDMCTGSDTEEEDTFHDALENQPRNWYQKLLFSRTGGRHFTYRRKRTCRRKSRTCRRRSTYRRMQTHRRH